MYIYQNEGCRVAVFDSWACWARGVPVWEFSGCCLFVCLSVPGWIASDPPWATRLGNPP